MFDVPISRLNFTAFDFETTGLSPSKDRIVEVGAVRVIRGELRETFHTLVNPGIPIPAESAAIHGITDADVAGKPAIADVIPLFLEFLEDTVLFAHNAPFDMGFLQYALHNLDLPAWRQPVLDTIALARRVFPDRRRYGLQSLAEWLGLDAGKAHSALDDAKLCAQLFQICIIRSGGESELTLASLGCRVTVSVP